jgi:peptidyl-dipeptidase A
MVSAPVYYHNYMLGEVLASQIHRVLHRRAPEALATGGDVRVGDFLRERVFANGKSRRWDALVSEATGEDLNPEHFVEQFVRS